MDKIYMVYNQQWHNEWVFSTLENAQTFLLDHQYTYDSVDELTGKYETVCALSIYEYVVDSWDITAMPSLIY